MDASVLAAIARWPDVPAVFGWLSLTARGQWRLRGEPIVNEAIREFIGRNYTHDEHGRWYFQNGPQRVYVTLELAPWAYRVQGDGTLRTQSGRTPRELRAAALLENGFLVLETDLGAGGVDDRDLPWLLQALVDRDGAPLVEDAVEAWSGGSREAWLCADRLGLRGGAVHVRRMDAAGLGERFGFVREPAPG
jgi:hypothetical protein